MMAVADLSFNQLRMALAEGGIDDKAIFLVSGRLMIDVGAVLGNDCSSLSQKGVIKFLTKLLDASIIAQVVTNQNKSRSQKLVSFSSQDFLDGQFGTTVFTFRARHEINSMTRIIGGGVGLPAPKIDYDPSLLLLLGVL